MSSKANALRIAATYQRGLIVLVDTQAAFPSVSQEFMLQCLEGFGVPRAARQVLRAF